MNLILIFIHSWAVTAKEGEETQKQQQQQQKVESFI